MTDLRSPPLGPPEGADTPEYRALVREWRESLVGYLRTGPLIGSLIDVASGATQVALTQNTWGKSLIDTVVSARASAYGAFDLTNNRWTATATCTVMVHWTQTYIASRTFGDTGDHIAIYKNGSYLYHVALQSDSNNLGLDSGNLANVGDTNNLLPKPISLVATDYVEVWLYDDAAAPVEGVTAMFKVEVIT